MSEAEDNPTGEMVIRDESPHDFFTTIPNLIDVLALSPYAVALYRRMKRRAGEAGVCYENTHNLAVGCRMSDGSVTNAKQELLATIPPMIRVMKKRGPGGVYDEIAITDIWQLNHDYWTGTSVHLVNALGESVHLVNAERSPSEPKNIPLKNPYSSRNAFKAYTAEIGALSPMIADKMNVYLDDDKCPEEWIVEAIHISAVQNARRWSYCEGILNRWLTHGKDAGFNQTNAKGNGSHANKTRINTNRKNNSPEPTPADLEIARDIVAGRNAPGN